MTKDTKGFIVGCCIAVIPAVCLLITDKIRELRNKKEDDKLLQEIHESEETLNDHIKECNERNKQIEEITEQFREKIDEITKSII